MSGDRRPGDHPGSALPRRLVTVRRVLARELREQGDGVGDPVRLLGLCAGDGRAVLPVLAGSPATVRTTLVEPDPDLAAAARRAVRELRLDVDVRCADAGTTHAYAGVLPVDVLLLCGLLADVTDVASTVDALPGLLAREALVLWWTDDDPGPCVRAAFDHGPFEEAGPDSPCDAGVGVFRFTGVPEPTAPGRHLFDLL